MSAGRVRLDNTCVGHELPIEEDEVCPGYGEEVLDDVKSEEGVWEHESCIQIRGTEDTDHLQQVDEHLPNIGRVAVSENSGALEGAPRENCEITQRGPRTRHHGVQERNTVTARASVWGVGELPANSSGPQARQAGQCVERWCFPGHNAARGDMTIRQLASPGQEPLK